MVIYIWDIYGMVYGIDFPTATRPGKRLQFANLKMAQSK